MSDLPPRKAKIEAIKKLETNDKNKNKTIKPQIVEENNKRETVKEEQFDSSSSSQFDQTDFFDSNSTLLNSTTENDKLSQEPDLLGFTPIEQNLASISPSTSKNFKSSPDKTDDINRTFTPADEKSSIPDLTQVTVIEEELENYWEDSFLRLEQVRRISPTMSVKTITKLLPSKFSGKYNELKRFIESVEHAIKSAGAEDEALESLTKSTITHVILNCLDEATYDKIRSKQIETMSDLHSAMKEILLRAIEPESVLMSIQQLSQKYGESVDSYGSTIRKMREQYEDVLESVTENKVEKKTTERAMIRAFIKGTKPELRTLLWTREFTTLDECILWATKKEKDLEFSKLRVNSNSTPATNLTSHNQKEFLLKPQSTNYRNWSPKNPTQNWNNRSNNNYNNNQRVGNNSGFPNQRFTNPQNYQQNRYNSGQPRANNFNRYQNNSQSYSPRNTSNMPNHSNDNQQHRMHEERRNFPSQASQQGQQTNMQGRDSNNPQVNRANTNANQKNA